jgi:mRNA interferase HicA
LTPAAVAEIFCGVSGNELLRKLRRLARRRRVYFAFDATSGKGGHGAIKFGERETTLRSARHKEIPRGTLRAMLSQLGINPRDL